VRVWVVTTQVEQVPCDWAFVAWGNRGEKELPLRDMLYADGRGKISGGAMARCPRQPPETKLWFYSWGLVHRPGSKPFISASRIMTATTVLEPLVAGAVLVRSYAAKHARGTGGVRPPTFPAAAGARRPTALGFPFFPLRIMETPDRRRRRSEGGFFRRHLRRSKGA